MKTPRTAEVIKVVKSKLVRLDVPIATPINECLGCGRPALAEQAFCAECADGLTLTFFGPRGQRFEFVIEKSNSP